MENRLSLHIPSFDELGYRQSILNQADTMSYNKGYKLGFDDYDNETGCIHFRKENWYDWYQRWISNEPQRYYAYLLRTDNECFVGEVSFHYDKNSNAHCIGIVVEAQFRGKGFCAEGLLLLAEKAFVDLNVKKLRNDIPIERVSAIAGHKKAGFKEIDFANGNCILELSQAEYLTSKL